MLCQFVFFFIAHRRFKKNSPRIKARSRNHCCRDKRIRITNSECVSVALFIRHGKYMRRIIFLFVACLSVCLYHVFPSYLIKTQFSEKFIEYNLCVLIFSTAIVCIISYSQKNSMAYYHKCTQAFM
jgi:hypothetical protein